MILGKFKVSGHSMEPYLKEGDKVLASSFLGFRKGDVVVFKYDSKNLIKRITRIDLEKVYLEGDNKKDSLRISSIQKKDILGKVIFKI